MQNYKAIIGFKLDVFVAVTLYGALDRPGIRMSPWIYYNWMFGW